MTIAELLQALAGISGVLFVITSMLANFVLVPLLAYGITLVILLEQSLGIGLVVLATAAGAPFLQKLVQEANLAVRLAVNGQALRCAQPGSSPN